MFYFKIKENQNLSMLHFELYGLISNKHKKYIGGNWLGRSKPKHLANPTDYLSINK